MPVGPGAVISENLRIERLLGRGGMGSVWAAQHRTLQTLVAVKVLPPATAGDADVLARFQREAQAAARVKTPHIVQVFDFGVTPEGEAYLVMELLDGEDLGKRIKRTGQLDLAQTTAILVPALRGLEAAHQQGVVHRDIKPENIFLCRTGAEEFVKLLDFGVAKQIGSEEKGLTQSGAVMGTPYYMSPEQILRPRDVDARTDLWAMGVVAYRCLVGRVPFDGETIGALSVAVHAGKYAPASEWLASVPPGLDAWFARALSVDLAGRFASAREMADALVRVSTSQVVPAQAAPAQAAVQAAPSRQPSPTWNPSPAASTTHAGPPQQMQTQHMPPQQMQPQPMYPQQMQQQQMQQQPTYPQQMPPQQMQQQPTYPQQMQPQPTYPQQMLGAAVAAAPPSVSHSGLSYPQAQLGAPPAPRKSSTGVWITVAAAVVLLGGGAVATALFVLPASAQDPASDGKPGPSAQRTSAAVTDPRVTASPTSTAASGGAPSPSTSPAKAAGGTPFGAAPKPSSAASSPGAAAPTSGASATAAGGATDLPIGGSCTAGAQCASGFCFDRVCCDTSCASRCMACTPGKKFSGGTAGYCGYISGGEDPDKECGTGKRCDGNGGCMTMTPAMIKNLTGHD